VPEATTSCPECERVRAQLRQLREERDAALLSLAEERERANAILVSQIAVPVLPAAPKPVRYWAVDLLNSGIKKALPLPHAGARAAVQFLRRLRKEQP
jgi:hypothetical protein